MTELTLPAGLNPPDTAPKDGTIILGDFGMPWVLMAIWSGYDEQWAVATIQANPMGGSWDDQKSIEMYFETDTYEHDNLIGWLPVPVAEGIKEELGKAG